jgi:hypothetical protein
MKLIARNATFSEICVIRSLTFEDHLTITAFGHYRSSPEIYYLVRDQDDYRQFDIYEMNDFDRIKFSST